MKIKRWFRSFSIVFTALILSVSVPAYAASLQMVAWNPSSVPGFNFSKVFVDKGTYYELPVLAMAHRPQSQIDSWLRIMDTLQGKNPDKVGVVTLRMFLDSGSFYFADVGFASFDRSTLKLLTSSTLPCLLYSSNSDIVTCRWQQDGEFYPSSFNNESVMLGSSSASNGNYGVLIMQAGADIDLSTLVPTPSTSYTYKILYLDNMKGVEIRDDLERDLPSSSEEETPLPSEPDVPPFVPPTAPDFGGTASPVVPYDPAVFEALVWYLRDAIGSTGKVLFLIVFLITAVPIVFSVIRHALSKGASDGGGSGLL